MINVKSHTRRTEKGKTTQVRSHYRNVDRDSYETHLTKLSDKRKRNSIILELIDCKSLVDEVTTSDLQGIVEGKANTLLKNLPQSQTKTELQNEISEIFLEHAYGNINLKTATNSVFELMREVRGF